MYRFTGFAEKANRALNSAIETAEDLGHTYIGTEHILSGILKEDSTLVTSVLVSKRVTAQRVEDIIRKTVGVGIPTTLSPEDFTPRCKRIMEKSVSIAGEEDAPAVGCEHILLAVSSESDCSASFILSELGVSAGEISLSLSQKNKPPFAQKNMRRTPSKSSTPNLDRYGQDMTAQALDGTIDPVIGRETEISRVIQILTRRTKNNPCLIGEPGVGKTAVAEGLAQKIADGNVPESLSDKRVVSLDLTGMVAGTKYRGDFEERIKTVVAEVIKAKNVILFIDELHTLIGAGSAEGAVDAANILKPSLARRELQVVGATTIEEYRKHIEKDSALERRFQPVKVQEPSQQETLEILFGVRDKYEAHHKVKITDEAINAAVTMSVRYISDRFLPDKAIDLIDEACSEIRLSSFTPPQNIKDIESEIKSLSKSKSECVKNQDFEKAASLRDKEKKLLIKLSEEKAKWRDSAQKESLSIGENEIASVVSQWTGIPVSELTKEESERLLGLENELHRYVIGQNNAVCAAAKAIRRSRSGLKDPKRPTGTFLFLGPTGVGKTELCKALAKTVFGDENALIRFDMSEYMEKQSTSKLIGSPPGYVGYESGGQLTEKVRRKPYSVILFDEIEKAHTDVFNMLLQILDDGILTDSQGIKVDFRNTVIIMTSNIGAKIIAGNTNIVGFTADGNESRIDKAVISQLKKTFRPEFLNRIDETIIFGKLSLSDVTKIAQKLLSELSQRLTDLGVTLSFTENTAKTVAGKGFDETYGARPIKRLITSEIEDKLSEMLLEGKIEKGGKYMCDYDGTDILVCSV